MVKRGMARSLALVGTGALVLAACGGGDSDEGASGTSEPDGGGEVTEIVTDVGVTEEPCPDAVRKGGESHESSFGPG